MKCLIALGLTLGCCAWAQSLPEQALRAADSTQPSPVLPPYHPLPASGASALRHEPLDWRAANAAVGEFPRGHQDLLRWERAQGLDAPHKPAPAVPAAQPGAAP